MTDDPYCLPGGQCLRNKLGLTDPTELREIEARIVSIRDVELARGTLPGEYNLEHYQEFHRNLFRDVYEWAGELRTVDITKEASRFGHWRHLSEQTSALLAQLVGDNLLIGRDRAEFVPRLDPDTNVRASRHSLLTAETHELTKALDPLVVRM